VDDVEVDLIDAEPLEAALYRARRIAVAGKELGRDEHLLARQPTRAQSPADALLVAVGLGGIDVAVAGFERPADRVLALRAARHLPNPQTEHRHLGAVGQREGLPNLGQTA
jgi:hypothetical protein